jgi:hypothetical protein
MLLRVVPKSAGHTDIQLVRMVPSGVPADHRPDRIGDQIRVVGDGENLMQTAKLDRNFFDWYWSLMSTE